MANQKKKPHTRDERSTFFSGKYEWKIIWRRKILCFLFLYGQPKPLYKGCLQNYMYFYIYIIQKNIKDLEMNIKEKQILKKYCKQQ